MPRLWAHFGRPFKQENIRNENPRQDTRHLSKGCFFITEGFAPALLRHHRNILVPASGWIAGIHQHIEWNGWLAGLGLETLGVFGRRLYPVVSRSCRPCADHALSLHHPAGMATWLC